MSSVDKISTYALIGTILFAVLFFTCEGYSHIVQKETRIVEITEEDVFWDENDFYILNPDGDKTSLGLNKGEIIDLTKHSIVLVKFSKGLNMYFKNILGYLGCGMSV